MWWNKVEVVAEKKICLYIKWNKDVGLVAPLQTSHNQRNVIWSIQMLYLLSCVIKVVHNTHALRRTIVTKILMNFSFIFRWMVKSSVLGMVLQCFSSTMVQKQSRWNYNEFFFITTVVSDHRFWIFSRFVSRVEIRDFSFFSLLYVQHSSTTIGQSKAVSQNSYHLDISNVKYLYILNQSLTDRFKTHNLVILTVLLNISYISVICTDGKKSNWLLDIFL